MTFENPSTNLKEYEARCKLENHVMIGVAGGSLAEGIDFKDDLCRLLIVVGIPFPNVGDYFVKEKMAMEKDYLTN